MCSAPAAPWKICQTPAGLRVDSQLSANQGLKDIEWAQVAATATWAVLSETPDWERFGRALIA